MPTFDEKIADAKAAYSSAKGQLCRALASTPEDRINWSPTPTVRTPVQIVAHCALSVKNIHAQMDGTPFAPPTTAEADAALREAERKFTEREEALALLEEASADYLSFLDGLTPDRLTVQATLPFGLGALPIEMWLSAAATHTQTHVGQLEYIQTIYGDRDWHL